MINIQNVDKSKCFKWCLVRYLQPNLARITKLTKILPNIKFPVKTRDIQKLKNIYICISAFGYDNGKEKCPIYV